MKWNRTEQNGTECKGEPDRNLLYQFDGHASISVNASKSVATGLGSSGTVHVRPCVSILTGSRK